MERNLTLALVLVPAAIILWVVFSGYVVYQVDRVKQFMFGSQTELTKDSPGEE